MSRLKSKIKFNLLNLANIINLGNLELVDFTNKLHIISLQLNYNTQNKLHMDLLGRLYVEKKDGRRIYKILKLNYGLMPRFCPNCNRLMGKHPHDSFFWNIHSLCAKCSIIKLLLMRDLGTFNIFALNYMFLKIVDTCNQAILFYLLSKKQNLRHIVINLLGQILKWATLNPLLFREAVDKTIKLILEYRDLAIKYLLERLQLEKSKNDR